MRASASMDSLVGEVDDDDADSQYTDNSLTNPPPSPSQIRFVVSHAPQHGPYDSVWRARPAARRPSPRCWSELGRQRAMQCRPIRWAACLPRRAPAVHA